MSELYNIIESLCKNNDIDVTALCGNAGIPIAALSELKAGRTKKLSTPTLTKIAEYFDVSVDYLLGKEQQKKTASEDGLSEAKKQAIKYVSSLPDEDIPRLLAIAEQVFLKEK